MTYQLPKILVLSGGIGGEREVSLESGRMVAELLDRKKFRVIEAELTERLEFIFSPGQKKIKFLDGLKKIKKMGIDCVFPALHGQFGEDGQLQTVLEILEISFVGSGSVASMKAMDKDLAQNLLEKAGFIVPESIVVQSSDDWPSINKFLKSKKSYVIKPLTGGSSVGVTITNSRAEIKKRINDSLKNKVKSILQEFLKGGEFTCGVIEKDGAALPLMPTEIRPKKSKFFDYHAKYAPGGSDEITPPDLPKPKIKKLQLMALCAHKLFGCRSMSRSDFIISRGRIYILEINTLPGMTKTSLLPQGAQAIGIGFKELLTLLVDSSIKK
ncbi:MAG: D-alanine--D-alanine ligase [Patescibacteria group bacterium]|nr:D-alanine--D-alanine ligase [Patescibacteria group bacterium]